VTNDVTNDVTWEKIVKIINGNNIVDLVTYFNEVIEIKDVDLRITRDELLETLRDWFAMGNTSFPDYTALNVDKDILKIKLNNNANDFFLPIAGNTFFVRFSNGVVVAFSQSGEF
jgi:predicted nucleotidyltransferase